MLEAIRFPDDYDGIIAGAPAFQFMEMAPWMVAMDRAQSVHPLDRDALRVLDRNSLARCDALDGVEDGVVSDPQACTVERLQLNALLCGANGQSDCLTEGQIQTARAVYEQVLNAAGEVVSPPVPPGGEAGGDWLFWMLPNEAFGGGTVNGSLAETISLLMRRDSTLNIDEWDPASDRAAIEEVTSPLDVRTADLSEFRDRGGKLLMYQGWNDYPLRPARAIDYKAAVEASMGGARETADFFRLFMVPGMLHCAGGPGAWQTDYVDLLVAWREDGKAPKRIVATQPGPVAMGHLAPDERVAQTRRFTRPLCPHPQRAEYRGRGDENDAANWRCNNP
tara:strand:- start:405 stop:1412 length:1008 start_codon:yes stop_codon:yes gene_type:complete